MVIECNLSSQNPKHFWISLPDAETQVNKVELRCDIWLNFALVTVQSCAVYMEMYRDSVIVLLHNAKLQAAAHCCLYKFSPKQSPIKNQTSASLIEGVNYQNILSDL